MTQGRVCITGGAGYFGSVLVGELLSHDYKVDVIDRLNYGDSGVKPYAHLKNYHFHKLDIQDISEVRQVLRKVDCIVHLAALVGDPLCNKYPEEAWNINVEATHGLVELAEHYYLPMILASTTSNYGVTEGWATEDSPLNPQGLYAKSKVEAERIVSQLYFHIILRFATLYGVSPRMRMDLMLNEWTRDLMHNGKVEVYQPEAHRPILHISDASRAVRSILDGLQHGMNKVFNVGCNDYNFTKRGLAEIIREEVGGEVSIVDKGDPRDYQVSFDRIRQTYGFHPQIHPIEGVKEVKTFLNLHKDYPKYSNIGDYIDTSI